MNKLIWKGIDSSTIKGLLICELPPITKPKMRVQETVIDGVDGSIIEELGYESYDKTIKIGLTYDFDIDEIIKYFSGEGEVVFSNEPDKYYKASILNRIDYERLLRFREATVKFRVQPFKYQYQEEKLIAKTGSVEGTEIKISDVKAIQLQIDGRSTQETRSGTNKLKLVLGDNTKGLEVTIGEDNTITLNGTVTSNGSINISDAFEILTNATYTLSSEYISGNCSNGAHLGYWDNVNSCYLYMGQVGGSQTKTSTADLSAKFHIYVETGYVYENYKFKIWLNEGSANLGYEAYGVAPSPEFPSEIESVGYENLFNYKLMGTDKAVEYTYYKNSGMNTLFAIPIYVGNNVTVIASSNVPVASPSDIYLINNLNESTTDNINVNTPRIITSNSDGYVYLAYITDRTYYNELKNGTYWVQVTKGTKQHSYIPYGKYGIEVETEGKNKLDYKTCSPITGGIVEIGKDKIKFITNTSCYGVQFPEMILKPNTTYSMYCDYSFTGTMTQWGVRIGINGKWTPVNDNNLVIFTTDETGIIIPAFYTGFPYTVSGDVLELSNIRIYEGLYSKDTIPDYEPYQVRTLLVVLNAPLRSLPNRVKDIAYIRNNKLYVDRYVGTLVFDGSENWLDYSTQESGYYKAYATSKKTNSSFNTDKSLCNLFITKAVSGTISYNYEFLASNGNATYIKIKSDKASTKEELKTWLSTHNTQVDYEFKTPVTEELGELTILDLVDGENNISNSENANMVIDYTEILKVNNTGNYISKPIFEIEGIGTINFILNNYNVFSYNFDDDGKVIIDSEKEDAYLGLILKNRNMNGDFPIFNPGENKITWDGIIKNINVVKKSRWL